MLQEISIPLALYKKLEKLAKGFDTPARVIERLLAFYEENANSSSPEIQPIQKNQQLNLQVEIKFFPPDEEDFKQRFLTQKFAWVLIHKTDGSVIEKMWRIHGFSSGSSLRGNLLSGYLRGWKEKGIFKAEIAIDKNEIA